MMRLFHHLRRGALGAVLAGAALAFGLQAPLAQAEPALWEAQAGPGTVYLFGTVHLLKKDLAWRTPKIEAAFAASHELWLEIKEVGDPMALRPLVLKYGYDRDHPLSSKLSDEDKALLAKDAAALGLPLSALEPMRPWLAAITLSIGPMTKAGYDPESGVDLALKTKARARHERIRTFETAEQQLRYFADLSPESELAFLHQTLKDFDLDLKEMDEVAGEWADGDVDGIDKGMLADMRKEAPVLYELLMKKRNEAMADQIAARLARGGTIFVAVGAAHLAGPDSIQAALERRGIHVKRL
jgi:uncharacterized protein YbaP (TraB family)